MSAATLERAFRETEEALHPCLCCAPLLRELIAVCSQTAGLRGHRPLLRGTEPVSRRPGRDRKPRDLVWHHHPVPEPPSDAHHQTGPLWACDGARRSRVTRCPHALGHKRELWAALRMSRAPVFWRTGAVLPPPAMALALLSASPHLVQKHEIPSHNMAPFPTASSPEQDRVPSTPFQRLLALTWLPKPLCALLLGPPRCLWVRSPWLQ